MRPVRLRDDGDVEVLEPFSKWVLVRCHPAVESLSVLLALDDERLSDGGGARGVVVNGAFSLIQRKRQRIRTLIWDDPIVDSSWEASRGSRTSTEMHGGSKTSILKNER